MHIYINNYVEDCTGNDKQSKVMQEFLNILIQINIGTDATTKN